MKVYFDGVEKQLVDVKTERDGQDFSSQSFAMNSMGKGIVPIITPTEMGEVIEKLNRDELDAVTGMSSIDMNSRLHPVSIAGNVILDNCVAFRLLPRMCLSITRQTKRLSVSEHGKGRGEVVSVANGLTQQKTGGVMSKIGSLFGGGDKK